MCVLFVAAVFIAGTDSIRAGGGKCKRLTAGRYLQPSDVGFFNTVFLSDGTHTQF
jgi:hypothetical protein